VQQPSARQRKLLAPGVTLTSTFPLAVAAVAAKAAAAAGSGSSPAPSADAVAALLVQHLPPEVAVAAEVAKGHLNFSLAAAGPCEAADAAAAVAAGAACGKQQHAQQQPQAQQQHGQQHVQQVQAQHAQHAQQQQAHAQQQQQGIPRGVPRHFELRTLPSSDPSLVQAEFRLFKKYQVVHHGDKPGEVTQSSFRNFLIDSPLVHEGRDQHPQGGCPSTGFGSFHQQYWLDGVLVAVGVVDVLPRCLSSKYLFWDPDLGPLSLGKLTSLAEIEWVRREQAQRCPSLRYYYLGFYIHNCHRMRYKASCCSVLRMATGLAFRVCASTAATACATFSTATACATK
jgi:arginine-tRNA-protein transferase